MVVSARRLLPLIKGLVLLMRPMAYLLLLLPVAYLLLLMVLQLRHG